MWTTPASRAAVYISRTSPAFSPSGFSHITCLPASRPPRQSAGACKFGVAMTTASISGSAQICSQSVVTFSTPHSLRRASSNFASASQAATSVHAIVEPNAGNMVIIAHLAGADDRNSYRLFRGFNGHNCIRSNDRSMQTFESREFRKLRVLRTVHKTSKRPATDAMAAVSRP